MPELECGDTTLHYQVAGEGDPVLLIQGVGMIGDTWRPQVEGLRDHHAVCWFDNRGIGRSRPLTSATSIEQMAADGLALLDRLGWPRAHVVGHSMGGLIAEQLALDAPTRVASLALLCTPSSGRAATRPNAKMAWIGARMLIGPRSMRRRAFLEIVMPRSVRAATDSEQLAASLADVFGRDLADSPAVVPRQMRAMAKHELGPRLAGLAAIPTLVVCADEDPIAPPSAGRLTSEQIGNARYVEVADAAHGVVIQRAAEINAMLLEHFAAAG